MFDGYFDGADEPGEHEMRAGKLVLQHFSLSGCERRATEAAPDPDVAVRVVTFDGCEDCRSDL